MMLKAYAQLLRLPNVFTAMADILLGWLAVTFGPFATAEPARCTALALLLAASACLYSAGMVLNDFFDVAEDRRDRPHRPIPSGRIARRTAGLLGGGLLLAGIVCAALLAAFGDVQPLLVALVLAGAIVCYDGGFKRTWAGPVGMGLCRFLNVLLGMAIVPIDQPWMLHVASVVGFYIVGVTLLRGPRQR